jgi:small subunit ribosomal protein S1
MWCIIALKQSFAFEINEKVSDTFFNLFGCIQGGCARILSTYMSNNKTPKNHYDYMNEFNTEGDEDLDQPAKKSDEDFGSMFSESLKGAEKKLRVGDKIRGKILNLGKEDVFVTTGTQHDGVMSRRDLLDAEGNCPYKVGDITEVYVTMVKGTDIRLSKFPTDRNMADDLKSAYSSNLPIQGRIVEVCKGGVRVNIKGKMAFCPISQIDSKHVENAEEYVGRSFEFKITEISEGGKNIVVSRRKLLDAEREVGTTSFLAETKDGDTATGRVTRLEAFGAFVELAPGVEGLVHISEIAWSRINHPSDLLKPGETVTVKVLKREVLNGKAKISLSIKQAMEKPAREVEAPKNGAPKKDDPWAKLSVGQVFEGKVNRKEVYGLFVQLEPGITGLLHQSRAKDSKDFHFEKVRVNDVVKVQIVEIRAGERQISLGLPGDGGEDDWKTEYKQDANASLGTLGSKMAALMAKKK